MGGKRTGGQPQCWEYCSLGTLHTAAHAWPLDTITLKTILNMSLVHSRGHVIYSLYWVLMTPSVLHTNPLPVSLLVSSERCVYVSEQYGHTHRHTLLRINSRLPQADNNGEKAVGDEITYWRPASSISFFRSKTTWTKTKTYTSAITKTGSKSRLMNGGLSIHQLSIHPYPQFNINNGLYMITFM